VKGRGERREREERERRERGSLLLVCRVWLCRRENEPLVLMANKTSDYKKNE